MIQGLYSSASAMRAQLDQQDVIANNLANISTPGFKRTRVSFSSFVAELPSNPDVKAQATPAHTKCIIPVLNTKVDQSNGQLEDTGAKTNLAIDGKGFFVVSKPSGETLTRSGNFKLNQSGQLITLDGSIVLGESGLLQ